MWSRGGGAGDEVAGALGGADAAVFLFGIPIGEDAAAEGALNRDEIGGAGEVVELARVGLEVVELGVFAVVVAVFPAAGAEHALRAVGGVAVILDDGFVFPGPGRV